MNRNLMIQIIVLIFIGPACSTSMTKPVNLSNGSTAIEVQCVGKDENCHKVAERICSTGYRVHNIMLVDPLEENEERVEKSMLTECLKNDSSQQASNDLLCSLDGVSCYRL